MNIQLKIVKYFEENNMFFYWLFASFRVTLILLAKDNATQGQTATVNITLSEGEINSGVNGAFDNSSSSLTSPGPDLEFLVGDVVHITVNNVGTIPHIRAIVSNKSKVNSVVFSNSIREQPHTA